MAETPCITSVSVKASTENLSIVRTFLDRWLLKTGFTESERNSVIVAVDEAITNLIVHGYKNDSTNEIEVSFLADTEKVEVVISDTSSAFDPTTATEPDMKDYFDHPRRGGLGILLMKRVMDSILYEHGQDSESKNRLILRKLRVI